MNSEADVTLDYTPAYEQNAGIGRLVRHQVNALFEYDTHTKYRIFISGVHPQRPVPSFPNQVSLRSTTISPVWLTRLWHRAHIPLPVEIFAGKSRVYHATNFVLPPTLHATKTIVTVHDLSFVRVPEAAPDRLKKYLNRVVPLSLKKATHIIADSQATKNDITDIYNISADKVSVVLSGVENNFQPIADTDYLYAKYNIPPRPFLLSVGTVQPRKNYSRIIRALAQLRAKGYEFDFVISGGKGWLQDEMYDTLNQTKMADFVHLIGFADEDDLSALYSLASVVVYPSLYEGFGFPILEAMACGTPVVTSNVSSLPEVAGDAALLVDPKDIEAIAHAVQRILDDSDLAKSLVERGFTQVKHFTWHNSAQQLHKVYQYVLQQ